MRHPQECPGDPLPRPFCPLFLQHPNAGYRSQRPHPERLVYGVWAGPRQLFLRAVLCGSVLLSMILPISVNLPALPAKGLRRSRRHTIPPSLLHSK